MKRAHEFTECLLQRNLKVLGSSIDSEVVLFDDEKGTYFGLNPIGSRIWELLDTPKRLGELIVALTERYDVSVSQCEAEVVAFLQHLQGKGLLEVSSPEPTREIPSA